MGIRVDDIVEAAADGMADSFKEELQVHMIDQPYMIQCTCGKDLDVSKVEIDSDFDLFITVHPCTCQEVDNATS